MNLSTAIVSLLLLAAFCYVIYLLRFKKGRKSACGTNCGSCGGGCH